MLSNLFGITKKRPWNQRRLLGQKPPLKLKEVWAIRIHLQLAGKLRDLALFNLAIDSKLRACDLIDTSQGIARAGLCVSKPNQVVPTLVQTPVRQTPFVMARKHRA